MYQKMMKYILNKILPLIIFIILFYQKPLFCQENQQSDKDTTLISENLEEVTITAFRSPYNMFNTPAPINVISPLQLGMGNALTTVEALNQAPGILMQSGTFNTNRLTIRGIGSRTP